MTEPLVSLKVRKARHMLFCGMPIADVAKFTGMTLSKTAAEAGLMRRAGCFGQELLTVNQAGLVMGITPRLVRRMVAEGRLGQRLSPRVCAIHRTELFDMPVERHRGSRGKRELAAWRNKQTGLCKPKGGMVRKRKA